MNKVLSLQRMNPDDCSPCLPSTLSFFCSVSSCQNCVVQPPEPQPYP
ncbi:hypothetical protein [Lysobacter enzymogenes]|nr:hypothetical protein [Lysobacter enzymogenes]UZW61650.1 hypothetical protein BV903_004925 [Lysobacter enzymogenes]